MKHFFWAILVLSMLSLTAGENEKKGTIRIQVEGLKKVSGNIGILVFNADEGFPDSKENAIIDRKVKVVDLSMQIDIDNLPYGNYAISIVHDENSNQELDKNMIGIPKEGFGFSNNKSIYKGLPDFKEASVLLNRGQLKVSIQLIHLFSL
tara:strand:- start:306 stop:755 length:450 start_codon:yes stop_codon:yes gene_type:complete